MFSNGLVPLVHGKYWDAAKFGQIHQTQVGEANRRDRESRGHLVGSRRTPPRGHLTPPLHPTTSLHTEKTQFRAILYVGLMSVASKGW